MKKKIDKVLKVEDAAKLKGVCREAILVAIRKKRLKATFFHGEWHIRESHFNEYQDSNEMQSGDFVTLDQAVNLFKISRVLILRAIEKKALAASKTRQGKISIRLEDLQKWEKESFNTKKYKDTSQLLL